MKGPYAKKSLGQHWLFDEAVLLDIVEFAEVGASDTILEVGPGPGGLTKLLLASAKQVVAVELDKKLFVSLKNSYGNNPKLVLYNEDIIGFDLGRIAAPYKVVANIPYYLTSKLIRGMLEHSNRPDVIVLLVQKEVAQRLAAAPGAMSTLSLMAQFHANVTLGPVVPKEFFEPAPKVDSQVVALKVVARPEFAGVDQGKFFRLAKAGFGERRKKLTNSLAGGLRLDKALVAKMLTEIELHENVRAQELSLEQWLRLYIRINDSNNL